MKANFKNYVPSFLKKVEPKDRINYAKIVNQIALANRSNNTNIQNKDFKKATIFKHKLNKNYDDSFKKILSLKPDVLNKLGKRSYGFIKRNQGTNYTTHQHRSTSYNKQNKINLNKVQSPISVANLVNHYSVGRWANSKHLKNVADRNMQASVKDWKKLSPNDQGFIKSLNLQKLPSSSLYKLHLQASSIQKQNKQQNYHQNINATKQSNNMKNDKQKKPSNKLSWKQEQALNFRNIISKVPNSDKFSFSNYIAHRSTALYYNKKNPKRSQSLLDSAKKDLSRINTNYQSTAKSTIDNLSSYKLNSLGFNAREYNNKQWDKIKQNKQQRNTVNPNSKYSKSNYSSNYSHLHLPKVILKAHSPRFMRGFMANRINQVKLNPTTKAQEMAKKRLGVATRISYSKLDNYDKQLYKDNKKAIDGIGKSNTKFHKTLNVLHKMYNMTPDDISKAQKNFKKIEYQNHRHAGVNMTKCFLKSVPSNHKHQKGFQSAVKESNVPNYHSNQESKKPSQKQEITDKQKLMIQKKHGFQR